MSTVDKIAKITDRAGTGGPNFTNGFTIDGVDSGLNPFSHTEGATEPSSPSNGDTWWDTANNVYYVRMNDAWQNWLGSVPLTAATYGDRGFRIGYYDASNVISNNIEYWNISASSGNAVDFGDITRNHYRGCSASSGDYVYTIGGYTVFNGSPSNIIDRFATATTGNATDVGDTNVATAHDGVAEATISGGRVVYTHGAASGVIEYFAFSASTNASDFGDLDANVGQCGSAANDTRMLVGGGQVSSTVNNIQYITMSTTGNALDFGDLVHGATYRNFGAGTGGQDKAIFGDGTAGGYGSANMQYVDITTTGNASDFGDLHTGAAINTGLCNATKAHVIGGYSGSLPSLNNIQQFTMATTGNATDYGDLLSGMSFPSAASGSPS